MKKLYLLAIGIFSFGLMTAQQDFCGFTEHQREINLANPETVKRQAEVDAQILQMGVQDFIKSKGYNLSETSKSSTIYQIPVVVHLIQASGSNTPSSTLVNGITDAQVQAWIDKVNNIYAVTPGTLATEGNSATAIFPAGTGLGTGTVMPFKLVLAKRSPSCSTTTGIVRYNCTITNYDTNGIGSGGLSSKITYAPSESAKNLLTAAVTTSQILAVEPHWNESAYFNIYVVNTFDSDQTTVGLMGWASSPSSPDASYDTWMKAAVVTGNDTTLAHEMVHSLGVVHPFSGNSNKPTTPAIGDCPPNANCATDNDSVCDTEPSACLLNVAVPSNTDINPCTSAHYQDIQYNIMNYGSSANRKLTPGQRDRCIAQFLALRSSLTTSLGATPITTAALH